MCYSGHFSLEQGNALNETQFVIFLLTFEDTTIDEDCMAAENAIEFQHAGSRPCPETKFLTNQLLGLV